MYRSINTKDRTYKSKYDSNTTHHRELMLIRNAFIWKLITKRKLAYTGAGVICGITRQRVEQGIKKAKEDPDLVKEYKKVLKEIFIDK